MRPIGPFEEPTQADCVDGEVVLIGPGTIAASMTPEAAATPRPGAPDDEP